MKIKTFILTFLLVMSCPFLFGQSRAGETPVTTYDGIISAIKQSQESGSLVQIYLKSNVEVAKQILIPENAKISIDLNDFVLSSPSDVYIFKNLGELTITDSQYGGGTIESRGIANGSETKAGKLTINGGNFIHNSNGGAIVYNYDSGEATITAGTFIGGEDTPVILNKGTMFIQGVDAENRVVIKENGSSDKTITCFAGSKLEIANAYIYGADIKQNVGSEVTIGDNVMYVKAEVGTMQGENFKAYKLFGSLKDAVAKASEGIEGNVVNLLYNTPETDIVEITAPITINGNNKTLTSTAKRAINVNVDDFKTDDVVTIKDLTIVGKGTEGCERGINIIRTNEVTEPTSPIVKIDNVDVSGVSHYAVHVAKTGAAVKVNIIDSDLSAWGALAVYGEGTVCNVTNSNLTGNNTYTGNSDDFATIAFDNINVEINVNGGTVTAKSSDGYRTQSIVAKKEDDAEAKEAKVVLNTENLVLEGSNVEYFGGEFDEIDLLVSESLVETLETAGYALGTPAEGLVAVTGIAVAKIDDTYYTSLKEALVAVANNQTIEIVANNDEGSITYPIKDDVVYGTDEEYANNFDITTKEGFEYEFAESSYKLVFTNGVKVTFDNANIKGVVNSFGNETEITLAGNNNIKTLQSSNGGTYSVAEGEQKIGTLQGELKVSGEPKLAINAAGVGSKLVIEKATLNGELPANIDVVAQGKNNIINTAIKGGNFVVAENAAVEVNADMTDLASFYFNNGAAVTVNEDSEFTVDTVEVAKDAVVTLNFKGNASFKSTTNDGTINLYMKEGTTFTTNNIDDTDGVSFVATTDENCEIFYEEGAYKAIRILNDGDVAMIGKVGYPTLQAAINAAVNGDVITLRSTIEECVTVTQTKDVKITIDGQNETEFKGTITVDGKSAACETAALTVKGIIFIAENEYMKDKDAVIQLGISGNSKTRYTNHVTIENCTFKGIDKTKVAVKNYTGGCKNITITGCVVKEMHSLAQFKNNDGITIEDCKICESANGMSLDASSITSISECIINVEKYGIRVNASEARNTTIKDCEITAYIPVIARSAIADYTFNFEGTNKMEEKNEDGKFCVIDGIDNKYEDGNVELDDLTPATGKVVVNLIDENLLYNGVYGNYYVAKIGETQYQSLQAALQAVEDGQTIEIIAEGTESNVVYPAADAEEGKYAKEFAIKSVGEGANYQVSVLFQKDVNVDLTDAVIYDLRSFEDAVISLNNTTVNGMLYSKNNKAEVTGNVTINKLYSVDGQDGAIKVTGTTNLVVKQNIGDPIINMTDVTLGETTSLAAGFKVVFENENTVNNTSLKGNIVFNNGTTTFEGASLIGTLTNNGTITVESKSIVTFATDNSKLVGNGTLEIAGTVDASKVAKENIANTILLNGADAKFYAPPGLTNVVDAAGIQEPTYIEKGEEEEDYGYYSLGGTYVAKIVKDGINYQFRTIKSALASDHFKDEITLINDTKEDNFNINKIVTFKTEPGSTINIASKAYVSTNKTLTIAEGANIQFNYLTNIGTVTNNGKLAVKATLENQGTFTNNATITAETLVNAADVTFNNNGTIEAATVTNNGKIENAAESSLTVNGTLTNDGTITNNGTLSATTFTNYNIFNNGTANNKSGEAILKSVANNGTINNYATLTVTKFTKIGDNGVQLYAGSIKVDESLSDKGRFLVNGNGIELGSDTQLTDANIYFVNNTGKSTINNAVLTGSSLTVGYGHELTINGGNNSINSLTTNYNSYNSKATVNVSGTLTAATVTNNAILNVTGGLTTKTLTNESTGTITNNGTLTATTVTNSATISNAAGKSLTVNGTLTNNGTITNGGSLIANKVINNENSTVNTIIQLTNINNGTLTVNNDGLTNNGSITISSNSENNKVSGTLTNNGTITVNSGAKLTANKVSNQNSTAILNVYGNFVANSYYNFANGNSATINVTGNLTVNSNSVENYGTVNVEGTSAVINIANNVYGTGTFNMTNVKLTTGSKLTNANIVFVAGTSSYNSITSTISGATLTNSKLTVNGNHALEVKAGLALGNNGTLENNGTVTFGEDGSDNITLSGTTLTNTGTLTIQHNDIASFGTVTNSNVINVLTATLNATSFENQNGAKVYVEGKSDLTATVTDTGTFEMENVSLDGDTKLTGANINFSNKDNQVTSSDLSGSTVTVNSGAVLTLEGTVKAGSVTTPVAGTINMNTDATKFYTPTEDLTIIPDCTGDVVVYNVEGGYYYINSTRVAKVGDVEYSSLQDAIDAAVENNSTVTIIAEEITESVTVSSTTFELGTGITAATINGKLTVDGTAEFNCAEIQFTNVDLSAGATMIIEEGNFEATSFATKGQKAKINVGVDAKLAMEVLRVQHSDASFEFNGEVNIAQVIADNNTNPYTIKLNAHDARLYTPTTGLNVTTDFVDNEYLTTSEGKNHRVSYKTEGSYYRLVNMLVAKVAGESTTVFTTIEEALALGGNLELLWEEGNDPIVMTGVLTNKNATITANSNNDSGMVVDWSEGRLYIGRMAAFNNGPATLTFDGVEFTSVNNTDADYGIFVSGRVKNSEHYNGTLVIKDSEVVISSIYNQNNTEIENSKVTFKTAKGVVVSGINAGDSPTGDMTTSTLDINNSIVNVDNITVGERGVGRVLVDVVLEENEFTPDNDGKSQIKVSTLNVLANGMLRSAGDIEGTIINAGDVELTGGIYTPNRPYDEWCHANYAVYQLTENSWEVRQAKGEQEINLTANWNWFSTYINNGEATNFSNLKNALVNDADMIKGQRGFVSNYGTAWLPGTLTTISTGEMYMIKMRDAKTIKLEGPFENYSTRTIELNEGWNWIGYPVAYELPVEVALMNFVPNEGDQIKGLETNELASYYGGKWWYTEDKFNLVPGHGYMYKSAAKNAFFYNAIDITNTNTGNRNSIDYHWNSDASQYPTNMSIIAMVTMDGEVVNSNYEVAAFANGELRGSARPVYVDVLDAYILMMNISGDEVEELTFKYYDVNYGTEYVLSNRINYSTDAVLGSMDEPYMLTLDILNIDEAAANEISIYPNPTTTNVEINLNATCDTVEVFNALGVKVAEYSNVDSIDALETAGVYVIRITNDGNVQNCRLVVK